VDPEGIEPSIKRLYVVCVDNDFVLFFKSISVSLKRFTANANDPFSLFRQLKNKIPQIWGIFGVARHIQVTDRGLEPRTNCLRVIIQLINPVILSQSCVYSTIRITGG
jgi:hypothetical protein